MSYQAPLWLPGPHAQTIWSALAAPREPVSYRRERWSTPDDDFIEVDFIDEGEGVRAEPPSDPAGRAREHTADETTELARADSARPMLVLFHGLEGCSRSHYAAALMAHARRKGWRGAVAHFRGCGGEINLAPRAYHSGDSEEIDWVLRRIARDHAAGAPLYVAGVSLGGNALLKWLGERGSDAGFVAAAAAVSAPQDLLAGAQSLSSGFNRVYTANFLKTLKRKGLLKLAQFPRLFDRDRMLGSRTFFDFDDAVTAPMHGFRDCYDYWERSSSRPFLRSIEVPTLVINARNDPFLPANALAAHGEVSRSVTLEYPETGGHVGFPASRYPGPFEWIPRRLFEHFGAFGAIMERPADPAQGRADARDARDSGEVPTRG